jgi:hypothetical protein
MYLEEAARAKWHKFFWLRGRIKMMPALNLKVLQGEEEFLNT